MVSLCAKRSNSIKNWDCWHWNVSCNGTREQMNTYTQHTKGAVITLTKKKREHRESSARCVPWILIVAWLFVRSLRCVSFYIVIVFSCVIDFENGSVLVPNVVHLNGSMVTVVRLHTLPKPLFDYYYDCCSVGLHVRKNCKEEKKKSRRWWWE